VLSLVKEERWLNSLFIVVALVFVLISFEYQPKARLFPLLMGGTTVVLLLFDLLLKNSKKKEQNVAQSMVPQSPALQAIVDQAAADAEEPVKTNLFDMQILRITLWLVAIPILLEFLSYLFVLPLITLFVLRYEAKESWKLSVILSLGFFLFLYLVFDLALGTSI
jgi:hypothetical protein